MNHVEEARTLRLAIGLGRKAFNDALADIPHYTARECKFSDGALQMRYQVANDLFLLLGMELAALIENWGEVPKIMGGGDQTMPVVSGVSRSP